MTSNRIRTIKGRFVPFWLRVRSFGVSGSGSGIQDLSGSCCIKGTGEYMTRMDSTVPLMHHDPDRFGSLILIQINPKERTLKFILLTGWRHLTDGMTSSTDGMASSCWRGWYFYFYNYYIKGCPTLDFFFLRNDWWFSLSSSRSTVFNSRSR